jgi:transposase-like protein/predicted nucleic acid-binding Zn ribbon protein
MEREEIPTEQELLQRIAEKAIRKCEKCGSEMRLNKQNRYLFFRCSWRVCNSKKSVWKDTVFNASKLPFLSIFKIIWLFSMRIELGRIIEMTGLSKTTISRYISRISRLFLIQRVVQITKIGGPGIIVEIDESKFGKRKYHRGHRVEGVWVLGMVERTAARKIVLVKVPNRSGETLHDLIKLHVLPGSIIHTDGWRGYLGIDSHGYIHRTVNHSVEFRNSVTGVHTNTIEGNWCPLKRSIPIRCRTARQITLYLELFMYRRNNSSISLFDYLINILI